MPLLNILTPHPKFEMRKKSLSMGLITNPDDYSRYDLLGRSETANGLIWEIDELEAEDVPTPTSSPYAVGGVR